ncbi:MAG: pyridoxal-phosphate dependent enzyme [Paramuribaculum sp.]|nr:pyridoxal-phosphate dependent enzyme [Paramuribaculum sp.]
MLYYSTANPNQRASLYEVISRGVPADGGFYMPERLPYIPSAFFRNMADMSLKDIGFIVINTLFGEDMDSAELKAIVADAINFDTPLTPDPCHKDMYALELFHGPSKSYKDFGARFMANILRRLHKPTGNIDIVVATTGDAGEAVARSFYGLPGTRVFIVYPRSGTGLKQLSAFASLGGNIIPVEVRGTFAQCHDMVRAVVADAAIETRIPLLAANSFNLGRLLPQTIYYFYAYARLLQAGADTSRITIAVPSGNLGNLTAGLIAMRMGLPAKRIIAVRSDGPDVYHHYVNRGIRPGRAESRDVPPNFRRIVDLYGDCPDDLRADSGSVVLDPAEVKAATGNLALDPVVAAARAALASPDIEATARVYLATTSADKDIAAAGRQSFHPAVTLPPSPTLFRNFIRSYKPAHS